MDIILKGFITEDGKLEVELPKGLPAGQVDVALNFDSEKELEPLPKFQPRSGAEMLEFLEETNGWWNDTDIIDSQMWVQQQRDEDEKRDLPKW